MIIATPIILTLVSLLTASFYWFELRPSQIRKDCIREADEQKRWGGSAWVSLDKWGKSEFYKDCIVRHGMEPEDLYVPETVINENKYIKSQQDTSRIESEIEDIQSTLEEQKREKQMENDCESTGGKYSGSGVCMF